MAFSSNVTAAGLIVIGVVTFNTGITLTITDSLGNTYAQAGTYLLNGAGTYRLSIWYAKNIAGGACTVTVTPSATAFITWGQSEYSGAHLTAPLDSTNSGTGTGTVPTTGSITVSEANEMIFAVINAGGPKTKDAAYAERYNVLAGANNGILTEDHIGVSASEAATATINSGAWEAIGASFKPASTGNPHYYYEQQRAAL